MTDFSSAGTSGKLRLLHFDEELTRLRPPTANAVVAAELSAVMRLLRHVALRGRSGRASFTSVERRNHSAGAKVPH